jgi:hypothetical protein
MPQTPPGKVRDSLKRLPAIPQRACGKRIHGAIWTWGGPIPTGTGKCGGREATRGHPRGSSQCAATLRRIRCSGHNPEQIRTPRRGSGGGPAMILPLDVLCMLAADDLEPFPLTLAPPIPSTGIHPHWEKHDGSMGPIGSAARYCGETPILVLGGPRSVSADKREFGFGCAPWKGGAFLWVQVPPGNRSSRKQPEQSWR